MTEFHAKTLRKIAGETPALPVRRFIF